MMLATALTIQSFAQDTADKANTEDTANTAESSESADMADMAEVDMITLCEEDVWNGNIPADLSWKTKQDKGKWIDELGIAEDAGSLVLVINSLDKEDPMALPTQEAVLQEEGSAAGSEKTGSRSGASKKRTPDGQSMLTYFTRDVSGEWEELFSVECVISGGDTFENSGIYGTFQPSSAFGQLSNPGSLLDYKQLTVKDYWFLNPDDEHYGEIYTLSDYERKPYGAINMAAMKTFFQYGMVLESEEDCEIPALLVSCLDMDTINSETAGIQMPEASLRMLLQCVDEKTCFMIVGSADELECCDELNEIE